LALLLDGFAAATMLVLLTLGSLRASLEADSSKRSRFLLLLVLDLSYYYSSSSFY
jgi:hypothetical protein